MGFEFSELFEHLMIDFKFNQLILNLINEFQILSMIFKFNPLISNLIKLF